MPSPGISVTRCRTPRSVPAAFRPPRTPSCRRPPGGAGPWSSSTGP
jgi:hypothetical protein